MMKLVLLCNWLIFSSMFLFVGVLTLDCFDSIRVSWEVQAADAARRDAKMIKLYEEAGFKMVCQECGAHTANYVDYPPATLEEWKAIEGQHMAECGWTPPWNNKQDKKSVN